ncbi:hypothetical protein [Ferirhizobium litorale]|uniref:Chitinase class I n=1 Tax=Ferirhizobium litorale TaxID=2927786 RepID=A0AAE3U2V3_9HYPH|nr:hypothetical protein [Fererhizobium litorale]MDI7921419.1 hypothetical protein [Fererhizobium litorale]
MIDRRAFFHHLRARLHPNGLRQSQVDGYGAIVDAWEARQGDCDLRWLAYMLATAFHESAATMQPVRETLAGTDAEAMVRLERAFAAGRLKGVARPYWRPDAEGRSWLGRGLVQITHRENYERMAEVTGVDLVRHPERAMEMDVAVVILIEGMRRGSFTGRRLDEFFSQTGADWLNARRIVNGLDRAGLIAGYGKTFLGALLKA